MKKLLFLVALTMSLGLASQAQTDTKVKATSSPKQTVHNAFINTKSITATR